MPWRWEISTPSALLFVPKTPIPRHLAEFWMIEPEMAFYDIQDNMDLAEDFIKYLVRYALTYNRDDLQFLNDMFDKALIQRLESVLTDSFVRITYTEAIDVLIQSKQKFEFPVSWGVDLQSEHERYLVEKHFMKPVIITDYPKTIKAFYMKQNEDGKPYAVWISYSPKSAKSSEVRNVNPICKN